MNKDHDGLWLSCSTKKAEGENNFLSLNCAEDDDYVRLLAT